MLVNFAGLSSGSDAGLRDLLSPGAPPVSLRETGSSVALSKLTRMGLESVDDVFAVMRRGRVMRSVITPVSSSPRQRARSPVGNENMHAMFSLNLSTRSAAGVESCHTLSFVELLSPESRVRCAARV